MTGDQAIFLPAFAPATIIFAPPGILTGSGPMTLAGTRLCVAGDEGSVSVTGMYNTPVYTIPGSGTLTISALALDQLAATSKTGSAKLMVKGSLFTAKFSVQSPAMQPPPGPSPPIPDATPEYSGQGMFQTANTKLKAG
jgi:hypothetical protein